MNSLKKSPHWIVFTVAMSVCSIASAQKATWDTVHLVDKNGQVGKRVGRIIDYTGKTLLLKPSAGPQTRIPAQLVTSVDTKYVADHIEAQQLVEEGRFDEAFKKLRAALSAEKRVWVQRAVVADQVLCYQQLGQIDAAGQRFLKLVRSDPDTLHFNRIPLLWQTREASPTMQQLAKRWIDEDNLPSQLLAASWLLTTSAKDATAKLKVLSASQDTRIATMAQTQRWRNQLVTAKPSDIERWQTLVQKIPSELRAGPYFLIGRALARNDRREQAATTLLRVPILFPNQRQLASESQSLAARSLTQAGQTDEAKIVLNDLAQRFRGTAAARAALETLQNSAQSP